MKTLNELLNETTNEQTTLANIASAHGIEIKESEMYSFLNAAHSTLLSATENKMALIAYINYNCADRADRNSLSNGYYRVIITKEGEIYNVDIVKDNQLIM